MNPENLLILKKKHVINIKYYKGEEDYYKIILTQDYTPDMSRQKIYNATVSLLKHPKEIIMNIRNINLLYELREIIDNQILDLKVIKYDEEE